MTALAATTTTKRASANFTADPDPDTGRRRTSGALLILGAVGVIAGFLFNPVVDTPAQRLHAATAQATQINLSCLIGTLGIVLLIPGLAGLSRALRFRARRLSTLGATITGAGFICLFVNFGVTAVVLELSKAKVDRSAALALVDRMESHSLIFAVTTAIFILGHLLGPILLGIALARSRYVPTWSALLLPLGAVGHFLSHAINSRPLDVVAFVALGIGFAVAGLSMITTPVIEDVAGHR